MVKTSNECIIIYNKLLAVTHLEVVYVGVQICIGSYSVLGGLFKAAIIV